MNFHIIEEGDLYAVQHEDGLIMVENLTLEEAAIMANRLESRFYKKDDDGNDDPPVYH